MESFICAVNGASPALLVAGGGNMHSADGPNELVPLWMEEKEEEKGMGNGVWVPFRTERPKFAGAETAGARYMRDRQAL